MSDEGLEIQGEAGTDPPAFRFTLYICGATERSRKAVADARRLCDEHLDEGCTLEIVDLYQQPELAQPRDIFAIPTLVLELPRPLRRFIGDLSDNERLAVRMAPRKVVDP